MTFFALSLKQAMELRWRPTLAIKPFQYWRSRMDTNRGFGKPLRQYLFPNTLTALFLYKWVFHVCGGGRSLTTYSRGLKESMETRDWCFSGNFRKSDSVKFHHLFRNLRSSKRLSNNPVAKSVPGPSRFIPLKGSLPRKAASEPHWSHRWSQGLTRVNWGHRQERALEVTQWKI